MTSRGFQRMEDQVVMAEQEVVFHSYPCAYYVQSPSTISHGNSTEMVRNSTITESAFHSPIRNNQNDLSSSRGSNHYFISHQNNDPYQDTDHDHNRLMNIVHSTSSTKVLDHHHDINNDDNDDDHDDEDDSDYFYDRKRRGFWTSYCSYRNSDSCVWISLQISWRFLVSLTMALLFFYLASRPPPPKVSIQMGRIGEFGLGEGLDGSGVTTKILTCNCSLNLIIENKSKLFGLHIHPPTMEMSFERLTFALAHGPKMYADSGSTRFALYIGTRNKAMYGAGRDMEDMLDSGEGMPLRIRVRMSSTFRVFLNLIKPKFHHQAQCLLLLRRPREKAHRTQLYLYNSTCTITS